ncbi:YcaO-like family protein [Rhizobium sp. TRM96647]|uniref:YcaO-like family protein n=1 Tax=unclassified Rhizobium TaxID=2613769 RepID=UPI0021E80FE5|nr:MULTISPECIES: YcaO-like family protein [unclassified Rhizobium]MCV3738830.1 YcaO-like family protein [Rhizobium sp. TRM96647]MCV3760463.1 YcaO-like family protein [Rhizobium sp. TRM96650]
MSGAHAATAAQLGARLEREIGASSHFRGRDPDATEELVRALLSARRRFGITRVGSLTRLDRAGVAVAQVVRPLSLSNAVSQGKGANIIEAAASALMEAIESWAAERIAPERIEVASARDLGDEVRNLYAGCRVHGFDAGWDQLQLGWTEGYDLFTARILPVPVAMVDTVYTLPSPHPIAFPRSTRGLAAGRTTLAAIIHAALEVLERAGVAAAERYPRSYPELRIDPSSISGPLASRALNRLSASDLVAGIWLVPTDHDLPVFRCQVIETEGHREIAPMPGEGFACDFTYDRALAAALTEAAQARVTALAGGREDITRMSYPERHDREYLDARRRAFRSPGETAALPAERDEPASGAAALAALLDALKAAGALAALVVPLYSGKDPDIEVVRLVVPPLKDLGGA